MKPVTNSPVKNGIAACLTGKLFEQSFPDGVSDKDLLHHIEAEGVSALIVDVLRQRQQFQNLSEPVREVLLAREVQALARDMNREACVVEMLGLLRKTGIKFLVLKGEALAHTHYSAPHLRYRSDVDLFFESPEASDSAGMIFQQYGYTRSRTLEGQFVGQQFSCTREQDPGVFIQFDLHHGISDFLWFSRRLPFEELYQSRVPLHIGDLLVDCPDSSYALLHACIHRVANRPYGSQDRLIWLYDIYLLARTFAVDEWPVFVGLAARKELAAICLEGIKEAEYFFDDQLDTGALASAAEGEPRGLLNVGVKRWQLYAADFWYNKGLRNKVCQLKEHLFPSATYMQDKYASQGQRKLSYLYVKRIVSGLSKYGH